MVWAIYWKIPPMNKVASLKTAIVFRLIIPAMMFIVIEAILSYFVTLHYVDKAYDRWLLDSARSSAIPALVIFP